MWLNFNELAWIIVFKFLYLHTQKNDYNIIRKENDERYRSKISEKLGLEKVMFKQQ
jgi:hypothetical protein